MRSAVLRWWDQTGWSQARNWLGTSVSALFVIKNLIWRKYSLVFYRLKRSKAKQHSWYSTGLTERKRIRSVNPLQLSLDLSLGLAYIRPVWCSPSYLGRGLTFITLAWF
jgi:hypothetical protein